jgi:hypothetical protein
VLIDHFAVVGEFIHPGLWQGDADPGARFLANHGCHRPGNYSGLASNPLPARRERQGGADDTPSLGLLVIPDAHVPFAKVRLLLGHRVEGRTGEAWRPREGSGTVALLVSVTTQATGQAAMDHLIFDNHAAAPSTILISCSVRP